MRRLALASLFLVAAPSAAGAGRAGQAPAPAPSAAAGRAAKVAGVDCPEAGRAVVSAPIGFDSVRVVVADTAPGAAVEVVVLAGTADRRVRAHGGGAWSLRMDEAPRGQVLVAIEPSLDAPRGACVERVELLRQERVVADVRLR